MKENQASLEERTIFVVTKINCKWKMKFNVTIYSREEKYFSVKFSTFKENFLFKVNHKLLEIQSLR